MAKVRTQKYLSKNCQDTLQRYMDLSETLPERMDSVRPEFLINTLRNGGGKKKTNFILNSFALASTSYTNSLLASTGMMIANVASGAARNYEAFMGFSIRNFKENRRNYTGADYRRFSSAMSDAFAAHAMIFGRDNQLGANMLRYFSSALKTGIASDVTRDINFLSRSTGMQPETLRKEAKRLYVESWADAHKFKDKADRDRFADSINLSDDEVARFFTDIEFMLGNGQNLPKGLRWIGTPTKLSIAIDESTKVYYRMLKVSDLARKQAITDSVASKGRLKVDELHEQYFKDAINAHNSAYHGEAKLANQIAGSSNFKAVRKATQALEGKIDEQFRDLFTKEDIPYEAVREFALGMTFQRRLGDEPGKPTLPAVINQLNLLKSRTGPNFSVGANVSALMANLVFPFVKTPYNIYVDGLLYTPAAFIPWFRPSVWKLKKDLSTTRSRKEGKTIVVEEAYEDWQAKSLIGGSGLAMIAYGFAMQNDEGYPFITGTPHTAEERRRWQQLGIPNESIRIGDTYIPFERIEPLGSALGWFVDTTDLFLRDLDKLKLDPNDTTLGLSPETTRKIDEGMYSIYAMMSTMPVLDQTVKLVEMFKYDTLTSFDELGQSYLKGYVPTLSSDLARAIDNNERIAINFTEKVQQRVPFLREKLPVDTQQFKGATTKGANWFEIAMKANFVPVNPSRIQIEIHNTEANIPVVDSKFVGVKLSTAQLSILRELTAPYVNRALDVLIQSQAYQQSFLPRQRRLLQSYAARASHPEFNPELTARFYQEVSKRLGAQSLQTIADKQFNTDLLDKGAQGYFDFIEIVGE